MPIFRVTVPATADKVIAHYFAATHLEAMKLFDADFGDVRPNGTTVREAFKEETKGLAEADKATYYAEQKLGYEDAVCVALNDAAAAADVPKGVLGRLEAGLRKKSNPAR